MSLQIGLAFGIFVLNNCEVSWSMQIFHPQSSYDSFSPFLIQNLNSLWILFPFVPPFPL